MNPYSDFSVLMVEDDPVFVRPARAMRRDVDNPRIHLGHASSLAEALSAMARDAYDAALLDLGLPDSVGLDTFTRFHAGTRMPPA